MNENQPHTLPPAYFDRVYQANRDPWGFETSPYEQEKYTATLAALPHPHYTEAFEIGCSLGVLTARLALRCAHLPQVELRHLQVPKQFPSQQFDLIVLSEVGYYWSPADLARAAGQLLAGLRPGGHLLLVHWTPPVHDYPLTGDDVHDYFLTKTATHAPFRHLHSQRHETYRLDLLEII